MVEEIKTIGKILPKWLVILLYLIVIIPIGYLANNLFRIIPSVAMIFIISVLYWYSYINSLKE